MFVNWGDGHHGQLQRGDSLVKEGLCVRNPEEIAGVLVKLGLL